MWPTLPSHRTRGSLTSAAVAEILGRPLLISHGVILSDFVSAFNLGLLSGHPKPKIIFCVFYIYPGKDTDQVCEHVYVLLIISGLELLHVCFLVQ